MKKIIKFLFDYTAIGWAAMVLIFGIVLIILLEPYASDIIKFIATYSYIFTPSIMLLCVIILAYRHLKEEWRLFNKTYNQ